MYVRSILLLYEQSCQYRQFTTTQTINRNGDMLRELEFQLTFLLLWLSNPNKLLWSYRFEKDHSALSRPKNRLIELTLISISAQLRKKRDSKGYKEELIRLVVSYIRSECLGNYKRAQGFLRYLKAINYHARSVTSNNGLFVCCRAGRSERNRTSLSGDILIFPNRPGARARTWLWCIERALLINRTCFICGIFGGQVRGANAGGKRHVRQNSCWLLLAILLLLLLLLCRRCGILSPSGYLYASHVSIVRASCCISLHTFLPSKESHSPRQIVIYMVGISVPDAWRKKTETRSLRCSILSSVLVRDSRQRTHFYAPEIAVFFYSFFFSPLLF